MSEGWEFVVATYGITAVALVIWFWMIFAKLKRLRGAHSAKAGEQ